MFKHYLITALRNLWRFRTTTSITIVGLSVGLSCFVAALGIVIFLTTGDSHTANANRIYLVTESMHPRGTQTMDFASLRSSPPLAQYLRTDFPKLAAVAAARDVQEIPVAADERLGYLQTVATDPEFVKIFNLSFVESSGGNPLSVPRGAIITEETAQKLFGSTHALGRKITLQNTFDVTVTGVMRPMKQPSHIGTTPDHILRFDILITEDTYWLFQRARNPKLPSSSPLSGDSWGSPLSFSYVLFPDNGSFTPRMFESQLDEFTRRHVATSHNKNLGFKHSAVPLAALPLAKLDVELFHGNGLSLATLILSLASVVLGIACVNYANLSITQILSRDRELGLRCVLGATRLQIATQQWFEGGLQIILALALAFALVAIGASWFDEAATIRRVAASERFWLTLCVVCIAAVFVFGTYTALAIVRANPAKALRGSMINAGTGFLSRVLVGAQFATASMLVIGLIVIARQNNQVRSNALHPNSDPVVVLQFPGREADLRYDALKDTLLRSPAIRNVSAITRTPWSMKQFSVTSFSEQPGGMLHNAIVDFVRRDFEKVFSMQLLAGRSFDAQFNDLPWAPQSTQVGNTFPIVIDRSTALELGWTNPADAVNGTIYWPSFSGAQIPLRVIGVVENNPLRIDASAQTHLQMYALLPGIASNIVVRIDRDRIAQALAAIDATWKDLVPYAPVHRHFLDDLFEREYQTLDRADKIVTVLTIAGASIALMGLFGMATFISARRRHEIGVRKTLGASTSQVVSMLLRDFSAPVAIANVLIWPLAFIVAQKYLSMFVQRIDLTLWPFALSLCITLLIAWLAVGGQAWCAARLKPVDVLRHE